MTTITINENINWDKTEFNNLQELINYLLIKGNYLAASQKQKNPTLFTIFSSCSQFCIRSIRRVFKIHLLSTKLLYKE